MMQKHARAARAEGAMTTVEQPVAPPYLQQRTISARVRYYWTFIVAALLFLLLGIPLITIGHLLRVLFGIEGFIFPPARFGVRLYLRSTGARVHITGLENLDPRETYLFIANHQSNLDPPIIFACLGRDIGALAKKELKRVPVLGQGMPLAHIIPVDRSNHERAIASTRLGAAALSAGQDLMAFPEGTRSVDGRLKPFKKGVFFMAIEAGVALAPVVINDTRLVMRKGAGTCIPGDVYVEILPPVPTSGYSRDNIEELVSRLERLFAPRVRRDHEGHE